MFDVVQAAPAAPDTASYGPIGRQLPRRVLEHPADHLPARGPRRRAGLRREAGVDTEAAATVLDEARAHQQAAAAAELGKLETALAWARLHPGLPEHHDPTRGREAAVDLAGEGAQPVAEFCLAELAAVLGLSTAAGRRLVAAAVELADRLPQTWEQVLAGRVPAWRAVRLTDHTRDLPLTAAAFVDDQVHPVAGTLTLPVLEELITETVAVFDPERAADEARRAADHRYVHLARTSGMTDGLTSLSGLLDSADADDLEAALGDIADDLAVVFPHLTRDARVAKAAGYLARGERPVPASDSSTTRTGRRREVVVYAHLSEAALTAGALVKVERGRRVVDAERFRDWIDLPDARVFVRPVIDLDAEITCPGYVPSNELHEQVVLRDVTCVFPWCSRPARSCQLDHIEPHDQGGPTTSSNLACLCAFHHRLKTHGGWHYARLDTSAYLWTSPHGHRFVRTRDGTQLPE